MYACSASNADNGHLQLSVTINNVETEKTEWEVKEKNLLYISSSIMASIDSVVYIPFYEIDTGDVR